MRRRDRDDRRHQPRGARRARARQPAARRSRDQGRPLRQVGCPCVQSRRQRRARPRGVSAPRNDRRRPRRAEAELRRPRRFRHGRRFHLPETDQPPLSRSRNPAFPPCGQFVGRRRRRRGDPADVEGLCREERPETARTRRRLCQYRRRSDVDAQRPRPGGEESAGKGRADQGRYRRLGNQRGLRGRRREVHPRPRSRP